MRYVVIVILLAGCSTPEQRAERDLQKYGPYCQRLGYERGSAGFASCVENQAMMRSQRRGGVCNQVGNTMICN